MAEPFKTDMAKSILFVQLANVFDIIVLIESVAVIDQKERRDHIWRHRSVRRLGLKRERKYEKIAALFFAFGLISSVITVFQNEGQKQVEIVIESWISFFDD